MRAGLLVAIYLGVLIIPLALAWLGGQPPRSAWNELASGAGMLAFTIILVEFVLSGRFRAVSGGVGMDVTMRVHQLLARTALGLALLHPFLYQAPSMRPYPWDATRQLTLTDDFPALATGIAAWVLLPAFVLLAVSRTSLPYKYEIWRMMHGLGAMLIAGFVLHHTLTAGRYSQSPLLAGFWLLLAAAALVALAYVYAVEPLRQRRTPWKVTSVRSVALRTWELTIDPVGHPGLSYQAGQFVWLNLGHSAFSLHENPFSISSAPASGPSLQFIIKELGDLTRRIGQVRPGTRAHVDGPHGTLTAANCTLPGIALVAGGVGIAPLFGMLRQLHLTHDPRPTVLLYGNRVADQIVDQDALQALAKAHGTELIHVLSKPDPGWPGRVGRLDPPLVREIFGTEERRRWLYAICGPPAMIEAVESTLMDMGVSARQILSERFNYD